MNFELPGTSRYGRDSTRRASTRCPALHNCWRQTVSPRELRQSARPCQCRGAWRDGLSTEPRALTLSVHGDTSYWFCLADLRSARCILKTGPIPSIFGLHGCILERRHCHGMDWLMLNRRKQYRLAVVLRLGEKLAPIELCERSKSLSTNRS